MRFFALFVTVIIAGCAVPRDVYLQDSQHPEVAAIIGVTGVDAKLELVDRKPFETFATRGSIHRVHVKPGAHTFGVMAIESIGLGYGTVEYTKAISEVSAAVEEGHVYGFRSERATTGREFRIVDLGTNVDASCFRPQLKNGNYVSQTCQWP